MKKIFAYSTQIAALTAAMALGSTAFAATGTPTTASPDSTKISASTSGSGEQAGKQVYKRGSHHHGHGQRHMRDAAIWVPGYGPLNKEFVDTLALTEDQLKLVNEAKAEQKAGRGERREAMKTAHQARFEQLKSGKIDPEAALKQKDERREKAMDERRKVDDKWLAVWDKLDDSQQQKVVAHFNERAEKFAKRVEERKQHKAQSQAEKASS
ncbi:hypothetical protein [Pollutimonas harenae]|uniref:LTXXQ motif family protein n=1 Tax=Pollutimonas harenae TaxID=657015 RepID=A0A853H284_9BURK|nr:hypothetical protein [Pollutimonas harenae]NYT86130.1 hypothetical protein [Pollutimonas harenae]TEA71170.1 hypothetical protein ERD84_11050 [Pollutimonas harenae]